MPLNSMIVADSRMESSQHIKVAIHRHFYHWAQDWVGGKVVLDAGCGGGYGAARLAKSAGTVVGIDLDPAIIEAASRLYAAENLEFQVMDAQKITFAPASFDVVICNALFEYLAEVGAFMESAFEVLKPGGVFICGTKNLELSLKNPDGSPLYQNHLQEFGPAELRAELEKYYREVRLFGERMKTRAEAYVMDGRALTIEGLLVALRIKHHFPRSWRNRIRKLITGVSVDDITSGDFEVVENATDGALYLVASGIKV